MSSETRDQKQSERPNAQLTVRAEVSFPARERLTLQMDVSEGVIVSARLEGLGCRETLELMAKWRPLLRGSLVDVPLPQGDSHSAMILRELLLKAQERWRFPYADEELCHCRAVPTAKVDAAIVAGCHNLEQIKQATSACTSCGSCRPDIEKILAYRLDRTF